MDSWCTLALVKMEKDCGGPAPFWSILFERYEVDVC